MYAEMAAPQLLDFMGEAATYYPAIGGTVTLVAMVGGEESIDRESGDGTRTVERVRAVTISTVAGGAFGGVAAPGLNDQIVVGGITYEVRGATNKSGNLVTLECVRIGSVEQARPGYRGRR